MRWPVDFNSAPCSISMFQLCFKLWFKWCGPLLCIWPLSSSFMLWAELPGTQQEDVQLAERRLQWKFKCTLEIWLKCAWVLIWIQWTTFRMSLCLEFNAVPCQTSSRSCCSDVKWREALHCVGKYISDFETYGSFDFGMSVPSSLIL